MAALARTLIAAALFESLCVFAPASAAPDVPYALRDASVVEIGCQDPCACPILTRGPLEGTFVLAPLAPDPLFERYALQNVNWSVDEWGEVITFTGSGEYRIGGEFALQHRLILDLHVNGGALQRFDSGLVLGGSTFPAIDIAVAAHEFFCFDSVLVLSAAPLGSAGIPQQEVSRTIGAVPNPFRTSTEITLLLSAPGTVHLRIHDVAGRLVRTLVASRLGSAGTNVVEWDGRTDDGFVAPAGVYLARLSGSSVASTLRIVRIR